MSKKDSTQSFASAFQQFLKVQKLDKVFLEKKVAQSWEKMMGKTIASRTTNVYVKNKVLFLQLSSAPLKQEILNSKQKVLDIIAKEVGEGVVEDLKLY
jgi:predicted nucleic acid-binding Zn ribbon protein